MTTRLFLRKDLPWLGKLTGLRWLGKSSLGALVPPWSPTEWSSRAPGAGAVASVCPTCHRFHSSSQGVAGNTNVNTKHRTLMCELRCRLPYALTKAPPSSPSPGRKVVKTQAEPNGRIAKTFEGETLITCSTMNLWHLRILKTGFAT